MIPVCLFNRILESELLFVLAYSPVFICVIKVVFGSNLFCWFAYCNERLVGCGVFHLFVKCEYGSLVSSNIHHN